VESLPELPSLTHTEARERASLLAVERYDIAVDLTDLVTGADFKAVTRVRFSCRRPGSSTFVDAALDVLSATLNGTPVPADAVGGARIRLDELAADNELVVETVQSSTSQGEYVRRSVDPSDQEVYVWTSFEPDDARRAWACFDQPDLKAPHAFTVTAPAKWRVVSNSGGPVVEDVDGARRWTFPDTPPLSTYLPVITAGPFHEVRSERAGYDLGLLTRKSLATFLDRDADELFEVTAQGLAFFGERFGLPFPQRTYDQVFVPDMGGAMENYGCVIWTDAVMYRNAPTHAEREARALVLLHEMAHMWFGDMVTMRWWEDLWLNEAFAEWACHWAAEAATRFTDAWAGFLASNELAGYAADIAPTTHPIRQAVDDVAAAAAGFDMITYPKGAAVLKQLHAFLGEDAFVEGLRGYFRKYAWGNTTLEDLMAEFSEASGRDLDAWVHGWLDTAGTDRLVLEQSGEGTVLRASGPEGTAPRPHRIGLGRYAWQGDSLVRQRLITVETTGESTPVPDAADADLVLVNDEDLTFASVQPDDASVQAMVDSAAALPTAISRAVAATTAWDLLVRGELPTADVVRCLTGILRTEDVDSVIEPYLHLARDAASEWSPDAQRDELMSHVSDTCLVLVENPTARHAAVRTLAACAVTDEHLDRVRELAGDDIDLRWRIQLRLAEQGRADESEVAALRRADPDPDSWVRELAVNAARPERAGKEEAWTAIVDEHRVPMGSMHLIRRAFWQRSQTDLLAPYAERYLTLLPTLHLAGMIPSLSVSQTLFPRAGVDAAFADRADDAAQSPGVSPIVARSVRNGTDQLRRVLRARGA
jgi:aminopeptidase N